MKKVTAEIIEKCRLFVAVKVRDDATNEDIEKAINVAYLDDDCEVLEQRLHEITNIKEVIKCKLNSKEHTRTQKRHTTEPKVPPGMICTL